MSGVDSGQGGGPLGDDAELGGGEGASAPSAGFDDAGSAAAPDAGLDVGYLDVDDADLDADLDDLAAPAGR